MKQTREEYRRKQNEAWRRQYQEHPEKYRQRALDYYYRAKERAKADPDEAAKWQEKQQARRDKYRQDPEYRRRKVEWQRLYDQRKRAIAAHQAEVVK